MTAHDRLSAAIRAAEDDPHGGKVLLALGDARSLVAERRKMVEALEFYGDPANHEPEDVEASTVCERDGGAKARAALSPETGR